jgi:lactate dehydrogenase-like 2-hydroxyacid dehydrogenase
VKFRLRPATWRSLPGDRLEQRCEVTVYPYTDRRIPYDEKLDAVRDQEILLALGEIPYDEKVIEAASNLKLIAAMHAAAPFVDQAL